MINVALKEQKENVTELDIYGLIDTIELLKWEKGIENFHVTECFRTYTTTEYDLTFLEIELCKGLVLCSDQNGYLFNNKCELLSFLLDSLKSIHSYERDGVLCEDLEFKNGHIYIEVA
jgi:hypothetical protein